ncbi:MULTISPECIES: recombinase family protein [Paracoccus]|uniref:recombinase family protein n=1 Tax=Paracoccus TaxID=265 RepID=UPI001FB83A00|nr:MULTISPECIES: recombinase family protein [Paracoccus]MCJ1901234.1 recombinase family protein [Paracoccus versutus]MDF3905870.1 recombinase family protein [Paracoccus sp. AS002]
MARHAPATPPESQNPSQALPQRAALYMRVSTGRQAESDLSIPDQRRQMTDFCAARGWEVAAEFVDAGLSGTDDNRPQLQRLLDIATGGGAPFDAVVVHSFSRFARDHFALEYHVRRLRKHGIRLVSITQDLGDDPMSVMVRQVFALFDEYQSKENAKHVLRAMQENARQGFWNGAAAPFGYTIVAAEQRGAKTKKKLAIDPVEAETVRLIFKLIREGDGTCGPMGVKAAAIWLNERGYRTRKGARWGIGPLHSLITSTTYKGEHRFNRKSWKTREGKPESEQVVVPVDPIIDPATFDAVQALLKSRNPKSTPPRTVTGPILLTGIATCAGCGGGMTLRTGKSGRYRYYACATCAQKGKAACKGRSIPMDKLDRAVTERLADQLLTPERVEKLLAGLMERQTARDADHGQRLTALRGKLADAEDRLKRLYQAIENGIADSADPTLKDRIAAIRTERDIAQVAFDRAVAEMQPEARVTAEKIASFVDVMRANVLDGAVPFRRAWLRAMIDNVEVDDAEIRIHGRRTVLERLVMGGGAAPAGVPSFVRKWRTRQDSNL